MLNIPAPLLLQFEARLRRKAIPKPEHAAYIKWLRDYLDFCQKYHFPPAQRESLPHFLNKLQEKKQTNAQQRQASRAVSLYYELRRSGDAPAEEHKRRGGGEVAEIRGRGDAAQEYRPATTPPEQKAPRPPGSNDLPALQKYSPAGKTHDVSSPRPDSLPNETRTPPKAISARQAPPQPSPKTVASANLAQTSTGVS